MKLFIKGIIVGIGGITPGLSGSVLMVILGLYTKVINTVATLFKDFKKNMFFLIPIVIGMLVGIVGFSRFINYSLENYEIQTRLAFLGLLIGTIPLFYKEVNKEKNIQKKHYIMMIISLILGILFLTFSNNSAVSDSLNIFQAFILGFVGISASIIPGIDGTAILSAFGLYSHWLDLTSFNNVELALYLPAGLGIITGGFLLSIIVNQLIKKNYTITFSILFGLFLSVIPSVLMNDKGNFISLSFNTASYIGIALFIITVLFSYYFSRLKKDE